MKRIFLILMLLIFIGCSKDSNQLDIENRESANLIFEPYLDQFKKEADKRGYDFTDYEIEFYLADINETGIGGLGSYKENKIFIDREIWNGSDPSYKEWLIFHELGHSILNRTHTDKKTESGECLSYMRGKENGIECYQNLNSSLWREYYLDELFDKNSSLPDWYFETYDRNYENKKYLVEEVENNRGYYDLEIKSDTIPKYVIEVTYKDWSSIPENSLSGFPRININGLVFSTKPRSNFVEIKKNRSGERFYRNDSYPYNDNVKLTIRKNNKVYHFFIDENLMHATDIYNLNYNFLSISYSTEISMDIEVFTFE